VTKKTGKLPKRIAGVKIPKAVRKGGEALIQQAQTPAGRAAIAKGAAVVAGVVAAAAEAAATSAHRDAAKRGGDAPRPDQSGEGPPTGAAPRRATQSDAVADAIGAGVDAVLGRLFARR
jgi:hypothetical protein